MNPSDQIPFAGWFLQLFALVFLVPGALMLYIALLVLIARSNRDDPVVPSRPVSFAERGNAAALRMALDCERIKQQARGSR